MRKNYVLLLMLLLCVLPTSAQNYGELNINDVRARFYAKGRVAYDTVFGQPHFEVPVGSGVNANYAGGLWLAGQAPTGQDLNGPVAWLFGAEGQGLSPALLARTDRCVIIPMAAGIESLNVAAAAAVCLFEQARQRRTATKT